MKHLTLLLVISALEQLEPAAGGQPGAELVGFLLLGCGCEFLESSSFAAGAEFAARGLSLGRLSKAPGVSEAPGVPGVRTVAAAEGETAWPQALTASDSARGSAMIDRICLRMGASVHQAPARI